MIFPFWKKSFSFDFIDDDGLFNWLITNWLVCKSSMKLFSMHDEVKFCIKLWVHSLLLMAKSSLSRFFNFINNCELSFLIVKEHLKIQFTNLDLVFCLSNIIGGDGFVVCSLEIDFFLSLFISVFSLFKAAIIAPGYSGWRSGSS